MIIQNHGLVIEKKRFHSNSMIEKRIKKSIPEKHMGGK